MRESGNLHSNNYFRFLPCETSLISFLHFPKMFQQIHKCGPHAYPQAPRLLLRIPLQAAPLLALAAKDRRGGVVFSVHNRTTFVCYATLLLFCLSSFTSSSSSKRTR